MTMKTMALSFFGLLVLSASSAHAGLVELNKTYGLNKIAPYYWSFGKEASEKVLNKAAGGDDHGGRIFLDEKVYEIIDKTFEQIAYEWTTGFMYGEGTWGGNNGHKVMKPHKSHKNGKALDIFIPMVNPLRLTAFLPVNEGNFFGYGENFSADGVHTSHLIFIDFPALIRLVRVICDNSGTKLKKVLIAKDLTAHLLKNYRDNDDARAIHRSGCRSKIVPIGEMTYQIDGRKFTVDHDEHIHIDFY